MQPRISPLVPVRAHFERCFKKAGAKRDSREPARAPELACCAQNKIKIKTNKVEIKIKNKIKRVLCRSNQVRLSSMSGWRRPSVRACVRSDFSMLLKTQFSGQGARYGTDFDVSGRNNSTNKCNKWMRVVVVVVFFTLTNRASTIPSTIRGCQSGTWSAGQKEIRGTSTKLQ